MENKIFSAIPKIMSEINAISKNQRNQQQGFAYRGVDDVMNELHSAIAKNGVFIVPTVTHEERSERITEKEVYGKMKQSVLFYTRLTVEFKFFADDGSSISATVIGEAMDSGDKASNKALSIAFKYACLQVFCIPTQDDKDPDAQSHEVTVPTQQPAPALAPAKNKNYTVEQANELKTIIETSTYPNGALVFDEDDKKLYRTMLKESGQNAVASVKVLLNERIKSWKAPTEPEAVF